MNPTDSQAIQTLLDAEVEVARGVYEDAQTLFWAQAFKDDRWLRERGEIWEQWGERRKGIRDKQPEWGSELWKRNFVWEDQDPVSQCAILREGGEGMNRLKELRDVWYEWGLREKGDGGKT